MVFPEKSSVRLQHIGAVAVLALLLMIPLAQGRLGAGIKPGLFPENSAAYLKSPIGDP